jgi:murein DD-endopeptidase MepM/ murein hydrolase activator NlpD
MDSTLFTSKGKTMDEKSLTIELTYPPIPFRAGGKQNLVFETFVHNPTPRAWSLTGVQINSPERVLEEWNREETARNTRFWSEAYRPAPGARLEPGTLACLYYWIELDETAPAPSALNITVSLEDEEGKADRLEIEIPVQKRQPLVIQPPVRGDRWMAADAGSNTTGHRRTPTTIDGVPYFAQRYAVDFLQFDANGKLFHDSPDQNQNWFGYGAELVAVADAKVLEVQDGVIENTPLSKEMAIQITLQSAPGNYLVLDLGEEQYALYAHLKPGSIVVKPGELVKAGQPLARLGNSGNSDGPHLHLHIGNCPVALGMQGLPFHLASYEWVGNAGDPDQLFTMLVNGGSWRPTGKPEKRLNEYMKSNDVLNL